MWAGPHGPGGAVGSPGADGSDFFFSYHLFECAGSFDVIGGGGGGCAE